MSRHTVLGWVLVSGEFGPGEYDQLGFLRIQFDSPFAWHTTLPNLEGPVAKVLLQYVHLSRKPIVQYHQRTGIVSFVCGVVLEGR